MSPSYDYECESCGHNYTEVHRISEREDTLCPICGHDDVVILISPAAVQGCSTPGPGGYNRLTDDGFQKEWDSIWADDPTATQRTSNYEED